MIVGIRSENPSADRRKVVKVWTYEVQTPVLFGQFIHDFFWVNRKITINANLGQTMETRFAHHTFQIGVQSSHRGKWTLSCRLADVGRKSDEQLKRTYKYEKTGVHAAHFAILSAAVTFSFQCSNFPAMTLPGRTYKLQDGPKKVNHYYNYEQNIVLNRIEACQWD